jgi:hypothetical protein
VTAQAVGLKAPEHGLISSFFSIMATPAPEPVPMEKLEGDNLAELWMSFLLLESQEEHVEGATAPGGDDDDNNGGGGENGDAYGDGTSTANGAAGPADAVPVGPTNGDAQPPAPRQVDPT